MFKRKLLAFLLSLALLVGLGCAMAEVDVLDLNGALVILHTNDIHGRAVSDPATGAIGYANIASLKRNMERFGASVLLLDAGDASQGTPVVNLSLGKTAIEFMNAVGYDAMAPGNHEFDWGGDNFLQNAEIAEFPILCASITDKISGESVFQESVVFEMANGMKVGVFGLSTPETLTKTNPDKIKQFHFAQAEELYAIAQAQIDSLTAQGADFIVCLGHMGVDDESEPNRSVDIIHNTKGIDLFIDGHSHTLFKNGEKVEDTLLVSTGEYFTNVGMVYYDGTTLYAGQYVPQDAEVAALVNGVNKAVTEQLSAVFAKTEVDLNGERDPGVRTEETNLGDFAADAILWAAQQAVGEQVVCAVTNGGGIRASIKAGDISMNSMKTVFPFGNQVTVLTVTGAELLEALESATASTPAAIGAFPQVAGIEFTVDTTVAFEKGEQYPDSTYFKPVKPGSRVTITSIGGQPFDVEAQYVIATNDFLAVGGDAYYSFKYANATSGYDTGVALEDALIEFVTKTLNGVIGQDYAASKGRITLIK